MHLQFDDFSQHDQGTGGVVEARERFGQVSAEYHRPTGKVHLVSEHFAHLSELRDAGQFLPAETTSVFKALFSLDRTIQLKAGLQPWMSVPEGRAFVVPAMSDIEIAATSPGSVYAIELDNADIDRRIGRLGEGVSRTRLFGLVDRLRSRAIGDCLRLIVSVLHETDRDEALCICDTLRNTITDIVCGAIRDCQPPRDREAAVILPGSVRRALRFIEQEAANAVDTTSVASSVGISVRSLQLLFGKYLHTTPAAYITQRRLAGVRRDIEQGIHHSVTEAAEHWGFRSPSHFARLYRTAFGERPSDTKKTR